MRQRFLRWAISLVFGCLASTGLAYAQAHPVQSPPNAAAALHWVRLTGGHDCIDGRALAAAIEAKLHRDVFSASSAATLLIEGHVEGDEQGYRSELRMTASDGTLLGTRKLASQAADCGELSETVALVLAVMIDPEASAQAERVRPARPPEASSADAPSEPAAKAYEREQHLLTFARAALKLMPGVALGLGAAYELSLARWGGFRVEGVGFFEKRAAVDDAGAYLRLAYGAIGYCPLWATHARARLTGCVGGELGVRHSEGYGFEPGNRSASTLWASATARAGFSLRLISVLALHVGASFVVPIVPVHYRAQNAGGMTVEVFRQAPLGAAFDAGLGARF
jgi:hypothetical protein